MSRIGFDQEVHPLQLQLRVCSFPDIQGIANRCSVTLNLQDGTIRNYHTDEEQISTITREYTASDSELKELYSFLTLADIDNFEALPDAELSQYETGYYDWAALRYILIAEEGKMSDGIRHRIYSNDPIEMALEWMRKVLPFDLEL